MKELFDKVTWLLFRRRFYFIYFAIWQMRVLTFEDDMKLRELIGRFGPLPQEREGVAEVIARLFDEGILKDFVALILRPPILFIPWNALMLKMRGLKRGDVINRMNNEQIAEVTVSFFLINIGWISSYFALAPGSVFNTETIQVIPGVLNLKNPLWHSPTETPSKPAGI